MKRHEVQCRLLMILSLKCEADASYSLFLAFFFGFLVRIHSNSFLSICLLLYEFSPRVNVSLSLMDQPGEPKLHVDQSVLQNCKMILQDVRHVLSPVHITQRAEEVLLHAGNGGKSHVNT